MSTPSVHLAVLVVASDPAKADLGTAMVVRGRANGAGHQIVQQTVTKDAEANIRSTLARWIDDPNIDVILVIGQVEKDAVPAAIKPLVSQKLEGFTDLFRYLAFQEMGAGAMLSNAEAAQCNSTFVFALPGGVVAVGTAMDKLIIPQLDRNTQPKNLVSQMPRLKNAPVEDAVPAAISPEKTAGGSGLAPKLPARIKAPTGKNILRRAQDDPPTKQIDMAKLERQLELSSAKTPNDAQTRPNIDLRKMLPKVPPGADESVDTDTDVELLAAPPPPLAGTSRIDSGPIRSLPSIKGNAFNAKEGTSPGAVAPTKTPLPSLTGMKGSAFKKEGTEPGTPVPTRTPATRSRPISVPPTNVFSTKEPTSPTAAKPPASAFAKKEGTSPGQPPPTPRAASTSSPPPKPPSAATSETAKEPVRPISSGMIGVPSSKIFAAAAEAAPKTNGASRSSSSSLTPSVEMAPLIETLDDVVEDDDADEAEDESVWEAARKAAAAEEAVTIPRKPEPAPAPRKPEPAPAPPVVAKEAPAKEKSPPPNRKWEPTQKVDPMPVTPELRASGELPMGTFNYPVQKRTGGGALKWLLFLFVLGAGFGAVVFIAPKFMKQDDAKPSAQVAETTTPTPPSPPVPSPSGSAEVPTETPPTETPTETPPAETPTTNTPPPTNTTTTRTQPTNKGTTQTKRGGTTPGPVTTPDKGTTTTTTTTNTATNAEDKPVETKPVPPAEPGCDEVACVLAKYDRPCCERYKPAQSDISKRTGSVPEDLDRAAVRSGIEKVKPAVVACGEKTGAKGTVKISVSVAPEGNVTSSEVAEAPDSGLGSCVAAAIKRATFTKSVNGGSFTYPFVF